MMTDYVFRDPADIRYSMAIVTGLAAPLMFFLLLTARHPYRDTRAAMASATADPR